MRLYKFVAHANGFVRVLPKSRKARRRQVIAAKGHVEFTLLAALHCVLENGPCTNSAMQFLPMPHDVAGDAFDSHVVRAGAVFKGGQDIEGERL